MDYSNFSAIFFHPNTELLIIEKRDELIKKQYQNYIPLYPVAGIFTEEKFSKNLKSYFTSILKCSIESFFFDNDILFFKGSFSSLKSASTFIVPAAIEKKTDSKNLLSVYKTAFSTLKTFSQAEICQENFKAINFRSFQIADCHISEHQYYAFENFWIKSTT